MTLQEHLDAVCANKSLVPVTEMDPFEMLAQAIILRKAGLTYGAISVVMRTYHGSNRTEEAWRGALRRAGATPKHYGGSYARRRTPGERLAVES